MSAGTSTKAGWWAETISDGGAHYAVLQPDGESVRSLCGRVFVPLVDPWDRIAKRLDRPADPEHGCPVCRAYLAMGRSLDEVRQDGGE